MTVDVFSLCYNEEFIIRDFILHYRNNFNVNCITIYDNQSTDNSVEIAKKLGCIVKTYDSKNELNDAHYLFLKNNIWKNSKADFVVVADMDEFLEVPFELDTRRHTLIQSLGYDMIGDVSSRLGVHNPLFNKVICFAPKFISEIRYLPGAHSCQPLGDIRPSAPATLLHRKYISPQHVYEKHLMYKNRLSAINKKYGWGIEYQNPDLNEINEKFEMLRKNAKLV